MTEQFHRDDVFVAGGQPSVTYVKREELHIEREVARAIALPNQIVSLAGPTKTGKTVLCRKVLGERNHVWIDGGKISSIGQFWEIACNELKIPKESEIATGTETSGNVGVSIPIITASGSRLSRQYSSERFRINDVNDALRILVEDRIILVVDDFHYIAQDDRVSLMRNIKGAVFSGLKIILLSVTHRSFDAIKAETELTGRFTSVTLPDWSVSELVQIPRQGFVALHADYNDALIKKLAEEAQQSPFLMQRFCWEICYDGGIERTALGPKHRISSDYNIDELCIRIAKDAGLPVYQKLVAGPQIRKARKKRPLRSGEGADIYEAVLLALAETGPKSSISYDELRAALNRLLTEMMPQKHEITSALKHLAAISRAGGTDAIDWDEDKREVNVADPYLRFYLRWQVRSQ